MDVVQCVNILAWIVGPLPCHKIPSELNTNIEFYNPIYGDFVFGFQVYLEVKGMLFNSILYT